MKMTIVNLEYSNIRKFSSLNISFRNKFGKVTQNTFIMMGNGTGKTTTLTLIKGLLDGTATKWKAETVKSFKPINKNVETGYFSMTVKFDDKLYIYFLRLNYRTGTAIIETVAPPKGREVGFQLPTALHSIFTPDFVRRFVFDGEQAERTLDSSSNEAEEAIKYLYRLDEFDEILASNNNILKEIQNAESTKGTSGSISNLKTRQQAVLDKWNKLKSRRQKLRTQINKDTNKLNDFENQRDALDKNYEELNAEKNKILNEQKENQGEIEKNITEIIGLIKSPYLISQEINDRMYNLGSCMKKLKLPKTISKDFFTELANEQECVCGRSIGEKEKDTILRNAEKYLGSDQQSVLNEIKSVLMNCAFDNRLEESFDNLHSLRTDANILASRALANKDKLLNAGGEKAADLQSKIENLKESLAVLVAELKRIELKDDTDPELTEDNNLYKAKRAYFDYESKIASATRTGVALKKKQAIENLVNDINEKVTAVLKQEIITKTNEKLRQVITDDLIEIDRIDRCIKLKSKSGASAGQTLSIAYCFLGTMFEDAELDFPFIIDSPAGSMDLVKRKAVADIIPKVFNQIVAFVTSAEVEQFADQFYENNDTQFITIIANPNTSEVEVHNGKEYFDTYQREHRES